MDKWLVGTSKWKNAPNSTSSQQGLVQTDARSLAPLPQSQTTSNLQQESSNLEIFRGIAANPSSFNRAFRDILQDSKIELIQQNYYNYSGNYDLAGLNELFSKIDKDTNEKVEKCLTAKASDLAEGVAYAMQAVQQKVEGVKTETHITFQVLQAELLKKDLLIEDLLKRMLTLEQGLLECSQVLIRAGLVGQQSQTTQFSTQEDRAQPISESQSMSRPATEIGIGKEDEWRYVCKRPSNKIVFREAQDSTGDLDMIQKKIRQLENKISRGKEAWPTWGQIDDRILNKIEADKLTFMPAFKNQVANLVKAQIALVSFPSPIGPNPQNPVNITSANTLSPQIGHQLMFSSPLYPPVSNFLSENWSQEIKSTPRLPEVAAGKKNPHTPKSNGKHTQTSSASEGNSRGGKDRKHLPVGGKNPRRASHKPGGLKNFHNNMKEKRTQISGLVEDVIEEKDRVIVIVANGRKKPAAIIVDRSSAVNIPSRGDGVALRGLLVAEKRGSRGCSQR